MPIRREHRFFDPVDWPQPSAVIRSRRARGCREGCGRPHTRKRRRSHGRRERGHAWTRERRRTVCRNKPETSCRNDVSDPG
ncbi:hypothetical protein F6X51_11840 [Methylobacterium planeticum]|uniref:Uncharacterized protein n=1 Tax=Methylobacterium planeticum TaxID=2615211 RepID=A0A6N6MQN8_9HYPH|nr:hypothetical protein F6X51_11840 [Methylobacterium planeticum]